MRKQFIFTFATLLLCFSVTAQTWYPIDSNTDKELKTIQFISDEIGFIGGDSTLLKTIDGGITWVDILSDIEEQVWPQGMNVYDLHFFDENHGYIMNGLYGSMIETFDGGITWTSVGVSSGFCQQASLYFENEDYGFAGGAGCFEGHIIGKYENGTWTQAEDPDDWSGTDYVTTINFKDANLGFAGTIEGTLLRTTNGGDLWDTIPNSASGFPITDIDFDGDLIRISHHNVAEWGSLVSTDDGLTWGFDTQLASFYYPELNTLHTTTEGTAYAAGRIGNNDFVDGIIFEREELFWSAVPTLYSINDIASHSGSSVFAVGENGGIYTNQEDIANSIIETEDVQMTIYPNPISSGEKLTIDNPNLSLFSVRVFDVQGKEMTIENLNSPIMSISTKGLERGLYFMKFYEENQTIPVSIEKLMVR